MSSATSSAINEAFCVDRSQVSSTARSQPAAKLTVKPTTRQLAARFQTKCTANTLRANNQKNHMQAYRRSGVVRAVAEETTDAPEAPAGLDPKKEQRFGFVIANAKFMLDEEEHMAEVLRERRRHFTEKDRPMDFFVVPEPAWIEDLPDSVKARLGRPAAAIVSTDLPWITFMKIRLDKVYAAECDSTLEQMTASAADVPEEFKEDKDWSAVPYSKYRSGWWNMFVRK
mmetsp:Transcript_22356/g.26921  ORF Transcript_22356/g.26921 Transcript_22356/m.26921 type:complete len:228 (-) Transcript_22356:670-1353(-)|eukprot:CAMPEP_0197850098 /NCGR_PEP_ID=MMETSP1438-20131217/14225_1 /TAXON_ID=1461541 /ORGANISM="Pterosperma sp., Strain CCMP1384" /LENGTH=227 /DNA_ID=CAMNT_0043463073 /DNA_START=90 /DNA_END=773 /DNA_ORIENTATION=+